MKMIMALAFVCLMSFVQASQAADTFLTIESISEDHRFYSCRIDFLKNPEVVAEIEAIEGIQKVHPPERYRLSIIKGSSFSWKEIDYEIRDVLFRAKKNL